jgi:hypothetical protein
VTDKQDYVQERDFDAGGKDLYIMQALVLAFLKKRAFA